MKHLILLSTLLLSAAAIQAAPRNPCGALNITVSGPWDYRQGKGELAPQLRLVEMAHFTPKVEAGVGGESTGMGGDLHYTLVHWPNHLRALATLTKVALSTRTLQIHEMEYPVECYFDRAIRWAPDDPGVYSMYGAYLNGMDKRDQALGMFEKAVTLKPEDATNNYNYGLALFKAKRYEEANLYAHRAYAQAFPLPGLKNMLSGAGQWRDVPASELAIADKTEAPETEAAATPAAPGAPATPTAAAGPTAPDAPAAPAARKAATRQQ